MFQDFKQVENNIRNERILFNKELNNYDLPVQMENFDDLDQIMSNCDEKLLTMSKFGRSLSEKK